MVGAMEQHAQHRVIATVVSAFVSDPVERWLWREAWQYLTHFPAFVAAFGSTAFAADAVCRLEDFAAVAMWIPPGAAADGDRIVTVLRDTVPAEQHADTFAVLEQMDAMHPTSAHWYLPWLAVDPARQSDGLGGRLLDLGLRRVDHDGMPAYLETPNPQTIAFYERRGFQVTGQTRSDQCPPITAML